MTLNQAKRWYNFLVGRVEEDIDGRLCVRTMDGKLRAIPANEYVSRDDLGWLCCFWAKKSDDSIKNVGVVGSKPQPLTESEVDYIWEMNYGEI